VVFPAAVASATVVVPPARDGRRRRRPAPDARHADRRRCSRQPVPHLAGHPGRPRPSAVTPPIGVRSRSD